MKRFIGIIQFLTRIPIKMDVGIDEEFHKSTSYFPLVGFILGICYFFIALVSIKLFNVYISSVLVLIGEVFLTGGLHLDGVGDTFDGLYSYRSKDRILEIMKDSRLGTNALLAILLLLLLKLGFIYSLLEEGKLWVLILMPVFARMAQVMACYKTKTPREQGMGNLFIGKVSNGCLLTALGSTMIISLGITALFTKGNSIELGGQVTILGLMALWVWYFVRGVYKKIDGVTGDILGCICEIAEVLYLGMMYLM